MLPEHPLPLPPQDAEVSLEFNPPQATDSSSATTSTSTPGGQPSSQADSSAKLAQVPSKRCAVLTTGKNSFGLFRLYDEDSIPSINDPEDQGGAEDAKRYHHISSVFSALFASWPKKLHHP